MSLVYGWLHSIMVLFELDLREIPQLAVVREQNESQGCSPSSTNQSEQHTNPMRNGSNPLFKQEREMTTFKPFQENITFKIVMSAYVCVCVCAYACVYIMCMLLSWLVLIRETQRAMT
jgi:hypothetical protein